MGSQPPVCWELWLETYSETPSPCRGGCAVKVGALPMGPDHSESLKLANKAEGCLGIETCWEEGHVATWVGGSL